MKLRRISLAVLSVLLSANAALSGFMVYTQLSDRQKEKEEFNTLAEMVEVKMHLAGLAVQSDEVKAIRLLRESADDGNQWAQYLLGKFCFRGEHTEKNLQEAERLLTASAMQKNSQAQYLLAKLYLLSLIHI